VGGWMRAACCPRHDEESKRAHATRHDPPEGRARRVDVVTRARTRKGEGVFVWNTRAVQSGPRGLRGALDPRVKRSPTSTIATRMPIEDPDAPRNGRRVYRRESPRPSALASTCEMTRGAPSVIEVRFAAFEGKEGASSGSGRRSRGARASKLVRENEMAGYGTIFVRVRERSEKRARVLRSGPGRMPRGGGPHVPASPRVDRIQDI
jgi:hypothetical protein